MYPYYMRQCQNFQGKTVKTHFHDYIYKNMIADSKDTVAKFWYQTLYFLNAYFGYFFAIRSGPSCSKLTMSLVNDSLKFTSSDTQIC